MKKLPDILFVIDPHHEHIAVKEANRLNIPVIAFAIQTVTQVVLTL